MATFQQVWSAVRDIATWGLGAWWGDKLMDTPGPVDLTKAVLVGSMLGLPFVFRADEIRRRALDRSPAPMNGVDPTPQDSSAL